MLLDSPNVNGIQEVVGSTPIRSTSIRLKSGKRQNGFDSHLTVIREANEKTQLLCDR